jgi:hypothetical protein
MSGTARYRLFEILRPAAHHVVDHNNLGATFIRKQVHDMRTDKPGAAGD